MISRAVGGVPASIDARGCVRGEISGIRGGGILGAPGIECDSRFTEMRGEDLSKLRKSGTVTSSHEGAT